MQKWEPSAAVLSQHPSRLQPISGRRPLCSKKSCCTDVPGQALEKGGFQEQNKWGIQMACRRKTPVKASICSLSNAFFLKSTFDKPIKPPETMDRSVRPIFHHTFQQKISAHDCCGEFFRLNHGKPPFGGHHGHPFLSWLSAGGGQLVNWHLAQHFWDNCYGSKWYGPHW